MKRFQRLRKWSSGLIPVALSSLSADEPGYVEICHHAATDRRTFNRFRQHPDYTTVLEHVTEDQGLECWRVLSANGRARKHLAEAARNDRYGGPRLMTVEGVAVSPTTLRYLKVADDIERWGLTLDGADVIEIGVGYGGQCRILDSLFELRSYTLVDLEPVLQLARRYLDHFVLRTSVRYSSLNELAPATYDFALSNYAFTELKRELQAAYLRKAIASSRSGYITFNDIASPEYQCYSRDELAAILNADVRAEVPLTHANNCILTWGMRTGD